MALSERESRIFADIERTLRTEADLGRRLADPGVGQRALVAVVFGVLLVAAGFLLGVVAGVPALAALVLVALGAAPVVWISAVQLTAWLEQVTAGPGRHPGPPAR